MTAEQLTLLNHVTNELNRVQRLSSLGLRPRAITTKAAMDSGISGSVLRRAKKQPYMDYSLPHGKGKVRIEFIEQTNHKNFWRIWEYEQGGEQF
jgi:hypothetical protein